MEENKREKKDFFYATLEGGELVMVPHCACGNVLLEDFYCDTCQKQCVCTEIRCQDKAALEYINHLLKGNPSFRNFTAVLDQEE